MRRVVALSFAALPLLLAGCDPPRKEPGVYPVGSKIEDEEALGGFGSCGNLPRDLGENPWGVPGAVSVVACPDEPMAYSRKWKGMAVRVVNRTPDAVAFLACDSQLHMVREALGADGNWRTVEKLPVSDCGNSYHRVFLGPNEYWEFPARVYAKGTKAKTRFRLDPGSDRPPVYSNEFEDGFPAELLN